MDHSRQGRRYGSLRERLNANSHDSETLGIWIGYGEGVEQGMTLRAIHEAEEQKFWSPCRMWDGPVVKSRRSENYYPRYTVWAKAVRGRRSIRAHRASFEDHHGVLLGDHHCNHICGNTLCINPLHLEKLTPKENMRDRDDRRRARENAA